MVIVTQLVRNRFLKMNSWKPDIVKPSRFPADSTTENRKLFANEDKEATGESYMAMYKGIQRTGVERLMEDEGKLIISVVVAKFLLNGNTCKKVQVSVNILKCFIPRSTPTVFAVVMAAILGVIASIAEIQEGKNFISDR